MGKKKPMVEEEEDLIGNVRAGKIDHSNEFRALSPMPEISPVSLTRNRTKPQEQSPRVLATK